ncbi:MAG: lactococcin 972 family bacteriocin [archaeon]|nr:lactococcin 972 family bacteriocin [archaeon]
MAQVNVNLGINCDANEILRACGMGAETVSDQDVAGGRFISYMGKGQIIAAFFHPTKRHSATCAHGNNIKAKSIKEGGKWAIAKAPKALMGNKTYYNVEG